MKSYALAASLALSVVATSADAKTLRYSTNADLLGLDPAINNEGPSNAMKGNLYSSLVHRNFDLSLSPDLATEWSQLNPETLRLKLRPNVKFHDGSPVTADDVIFSLARFKAEQSEMKSYVATVKEIRKIDDLAIELVTEGPDPVLLQQLPSFYIMPKAWSEKNNTTQVVRGTSAPTFINFNENGSGPYKLVERVADNRTVLVVNENWWGGAAKRGNVDRAEFRPIANAATRVAALLSGEIDLMYPVPSQDIQRINQTPGAKVLEGPELRTVFFGFDQFRDELLDMKGTGKNPFKDKRVREAFYKAIDIQAIYRVVMRNGSRPTGSMVAPGVQGFSAEVDKRPPFDLEASKKLLAEAGYPSGFPVQLDCPNDRYTNDEAICQAAVPMLARAGITVKLNAQTRSLHFDKIGEKDGFNTSFYMLGWTPGTFDVHNALVNLMTRSKYPAWGINNDGRYSNPRVEELTLKAETEMDPKKRLAELEEAQMIHKNDYGHIPLHQQTLAWGVRDTIADNVKPRPQNDVDLTQISMK
ncbi:MAG: ABC transporter substrate-binding protein [Proteobacteria bacterium]|nr:ABC transporter substrate-binding protein [Pseudomonadota bacterium]MBI3497270.1 ABC transporter substrate-binding protein [Pseudomonadota bacterium]